MKKAMALLLSLTLLLGLLAIPAAAQQSGVDAVAMVQALGILQGDASGNLNLTATVTRAEFCKMLVAASSFKDAVGGSSGFSLFKDVKKDHWAVEYIKVCVDNGWFTGYTDGTFRPSSPIKLEEAASAVLRLLGYTSADLAGSYPTAQLSKFDALGLHAGFSTARGQLMTRQDCANLFYNLMAATNKLGQNYATTLGYKTDAAGNVDYATLVTANTKGPYTFQSGTISSKLNFTPTAVYRDGKASSLSAVNAYDIYYYNANLRTVWIYSDRITGTYTVASPSTAAPTAVTVAGRQYSIESSAAAYKLSSQGNYAIGDTVTLLLGMNGGVADVCDPLQATGYYSGIVTSSETKSVTDSTGKVTVVNMATVACTDGVTRTYETGTSKLSEGVLVQTSGTGLTGLSGRSTSGRVSDDGKKLGDMTFAAGVEIIDTDKDGAFVRVFPSRLAGHTLSSSSVLYYETNTAGEISHLILRNATGDMYGYGVVTDVKENVDTSVGGFSGTYQYQLNGQTGMFSTASSAFNVQTGPAMFRLNGTTLESMKNLTGVNLDSATALSANASGTKYAVSETCQIFIRRSDNYYPANLATVTDGSYQLKGYYDNFGYSAGKLIRVIVATAK